MKKKSFLFSSLMAGIIALASIVLTNVNPDLVYRANAEIKSYGITFDSSNNKLHQAEDEVFYVGDALANTDLGSSISFRYCGVAKGTSWHLFGSNTGYMYNFYNVDPIRGMQSISITSNTEGASYAIFYSDDNSLSLYKAFTSKKGSTEVFNFDNFFPNYFAIGLASGSSNFDVTSIKIKFSCKDNYPNYPILTVSSESEIMGSTEGGGPKRPGSEVTIKSWPNGGGISFIGWYDENEILVSTESSYTFTMPTKDVHYIAKFKQDIYLITVKSSDEKMGSVTGGGSFHYEDIVNVTATPNDGYSFLDWYIAEEEKSIWFDANYSFVACLSVNLVARFVKNYKLNIVTDNINQGTVTGPLERGAGLQVTVKAQAKKGYAFDYWHDSELNSLSNKAEYTFTMPAHDTSIYAAFTKGYTFMVSSEDEKMGTVNSEASGQYKEGAEITITAYSESRIFKGWYDSLDNLITSKKLFSFRMPANDYELTAKFYRVDEYSSKQAGKPFLSSDGKTVFYGLYPQTNVSDPDILESLNKIAIPESNGWYLYDGEYYAKLISSVDYYTDDYRFDNGITIKNNYEYWYKCQPISWDVLNNSNGEYRLVSSDLLDGRYYKSEFSDTDNYPYDSNYEYSDIREWLNNDFYNNAFSSGIKI